MESFFELFDSGQDGPARNKSCDNCKTNKKNLTDYKVNMDDDIVDRLPPEPEQGNVEYKLKLINPSSERFEHLVTQMKWRLKEGHGEAIYQIGNFFLYILS